MKGYIYKIENKLNGKCYIGQTINGADRFKDHLYYSENNPIQPIHFAISKYGKDNFKFSILEEVFANSCDSLKDILNEKEMEFINRFNSYLSGYNCSLGVKVI